MKIKVSKFKKIDSVEITLEPLNIFIGTNNSGKSSFIQGVQFAISSCQTLKIKGTSWSRTGYQVLALDSTDYLYTPTRYIENLYHGRRLTGARTRHDRKSISFEFENSDRATLNISRGKNGGFTTILSGKNLGQLLGDIENPYCVYVPGIAGIPIQEKYEVPIAIKKSATRGDSNNYLRNIILTISKDATKWATFLESINKIYPDVTLRVKFEENISEFIDVYVRNSGNELPLDSTGTGLLQTIQIFAYIEYFNPKIILLDEPDSHIHPTKQKLLALELLRRTKINPELKTVFSTHSRYILEALENEANVVHFQNGKAFPNIKGSKILLDIGAADADYLFSKNSLKYIVATEDKVDNVQEKKEFLKKFLLANGLSEEEFVLHSYEGCTKVDFAKILQGFVQKQIPTARVIVHIDRDQKTDDDREMIKLRTACESRDLLLFVTKFQEVESYFCQPEHLSLVYNIPIAQSQKIYEDLIIELEEETKRKLSNFILRDRPELGLNKDGKPDIAIVQEKANEWYSSHKYEFTPGKELLGKIKNHLQTVLKADPNKIVESSPALLSQEFTEIIKQA